MTKISTRNAAIAGCALVACACSDHDPISDVRKVPRGVQTAQAEPAPPETAPAAAPTRTPQRPSRTGGKPNIMFIMGDDIGWMQPSIYHRGLMVGETPNIDRIGREGGMFVDYVAMQSCTSGRNAFFT